VNKWRLLLPALLSLISVVSAILLNTGLAESKITNPDALAFLKIVSILAASGIPLYSLYRAEERASEAETARQDRENLEDLERMLAAAVKRVFPNEDPSRIRANIMLEAEEHALVILCSVGMDLYRDGDLQLAFGQGCAGTAWKRACEASMATRWVPVVAPNAKLAPDRLKHDWGFEDDQVSMTNHVLWVISTPIFLLSGGVASFAGVLNFDGVVSPLGQSDRLEDPQLHRDIADIADFFAAKLREAGYA
jgi:hypothetical protein